jgi:hypothetical protein
LQVVPYCALPAQVLSGRASARRAELKASRHRARPTLVIGGATDPAPALYPAVAERLHAASQVHEVDRLALHR